MSEAALLEGSAEFAAHVGRTVQLRGRYQAEFDPAHKMPVRGPDGALTPAGCVVVLALADGSFVDLYNRPVEEGRRLDGQSVLVTGELAAPLGDDDDAAFAQPLPIYALISIATIEPAT